MELPSAMALVFVIVFVACFLWMARRTKSTPSSPRKQRSMRWLPLICVLTLWSLHVVQGAQKDELMTSRWVVFFGCWTVCVLVAGYYVLRKPTELEVQRTYACAPRYCGQCDYDLTGNVSGICPECGWVIPEKPVRLETADWALWWRKWEIDYLESWRTRLATFLGFGTVFLALALVFLFKRDFWLFGLVPAFMGVHFVINACRVIAYARRQRAMHSSEE